MEKREKKDKRKKKEKRRIKNSDFKVAFQKALVLKDLDEYFNIKKCIKYKKMILILLSMLLLVAIICLIKSKQKKTGKLPRIREFENVLSKEECLQIIRYAENKLERSKVGSDRRISEVRTSSQVFIPNDALPCIKRCSKLVEELTGIPAKNQEKWQVLKYNPGQEYREHYDACMDEPCHESDRKRGWGKRVYTFFIYLNDVEEGGETVFPRLNKSFKPKQGNAIFWHNLTKNRQKAHPDSLHAGLPVIKGEKWAINVWVREHPER